MQGGARGQASTAWRAIQRRSGPFLLPTLRADPERARCGDWLESELRIIRPRLIVPVGKLAIERFVGIQPLSDVVGREHTVNHEGGTSVVIPLPHPSGASSWIHQDGHMKLLNRSLALLAVHVEMLGPPTRSVA